MSHSDWQMAEDVFKFEWREEGNKGVKIVSKFTGSPRIKS